MRVEADAAQLAATFETAARGCSTRHAVAVLGALRLEAGGGKLAACGTDMDVAVFARCVCKPVGRQSGARVTGVYAPKAQFEHGDYDPLEGVRS